MPGGRGTLFVVCALAAAALAGCGGGDDEPSTAELKAQLPAASNVGINFKLHRTYEWKNPIDFVVQGIPLPQSTDPSSAVDVMEDSGFDGAAGEDLERGEANVAVLVARFGSDDDARDVGEYVHREGLKLPCYRSCGEQPGEFAVSGIPGAKGVQQEPAESPPPDAPPPFTAYGVGFTVGDRFYFVGGAGSPGSIDKSTVIEEAQKLYRTAAASS